jgi:hypothetical protein
LGPNFEGNFHGFVDVKGTFTTIDVHDAAFTRAFGINDRGAIVGSYFDSTFLPVLKTGET